jgi:hypothetical protein
MKRRVLRSDATVILGHAPGTVRMKRHVHKSEVLGSGPRLTVRV